MRTPSSEREKLLLLFPEGNMASENGEVGFITPAGLETELRETLRTADVKDSAVLRVFC